MKKLIFAMGLLGVVGLSACVPVHESPVASVTASASQSITADGGNRQLLCKHLLSTADQNLIIAKKRAKQAHVLSDWSTADRDLSRAAKAYAEKDYGMCLEKAKAVDTSIERNDSYRQWRTSFNF